MLRPTGSQAARAQELHKRLEDYMQRKRLRSTEQRRIVTDVFFHSPGHLSIEELLALSRKKNPHVGYATVYRTLKLLTESGLANERHFGDGISRYEIAYKGTHHDHLICTNCGNIEEFEDSRIERLQTEIATKYGFELKSHKHELYATACPKCKKQKNSA